MRTLLSKTRRPIAWAPRTVWILSVTTSLVLACLAGLAGWALQTWAQSGEIEIASTDRTRTAVEHFQAGNHVYVAADGRRFIDEASQQRLEAQAAASPHPIYIMVWSRGDYREDWLPAENVARTFDVDGFYLVYQGPEEIPDVLQFGRQGVEFSYLGKLLGDPQKRLSEVIEEVSNAPEERNEITYRPEDDTIYKGEVEFGGGRPTAAFAGVFIGVLSLIVVVPLMLAIEWWIRRARR